MKYVAVTFLALTMTVVAVATVKAAGWFNETKAEASTVNPAPTDAERWYRSNQPKHWRAFMLQVR